MALEPYQRKVLLDYFAGARETLILLPKKNGKTTLLAALALFHLLTVDDAECVVGARSRDQAGILYDQAAGFVRRSPGLQARLLVRRGYREIRSRRDSGRIRVLAADVDTADGVIPTLAMVDELGRAKSAELYGIFRDGLGPRDGQLLAISVAGDHETSPLGKMRTAAHRLPDAKRTGRYLYARSADGSFAWHEWALDIDDDVDDLKLVKLANPASWNTTGLLLRERRDSPSTMLWQWARFCNLWVGATPGGYAPTIGMRPRSRRGSPTATASLGFDGSRVADATALVACRMDDGLLQPLGVWEQDPHNPDWEVPGGEVDAAIADAMGRYKVVRGYFDPPLFQTEIDGWAREFGEAAVMRYSTARSRMMSAVERFRTDLVAGRSRTGRRGAHRPYAQRATREVRGGYWSPSRPPRPTKSTASRACSPEARADHPPAASASDAARSDVLDSRGGAAQPDLRRETERRSGGETPRQRAHAPRPRVGLSRPRPGGAARHARRLPPAHRVRTVLAMRSLVSVRPRPRALGAHRPRDEDAPRRGRHAARARRQAPAMRAMRRRCKRAPRRPRPTRHRRLARCLRLGVPSSA
jgi:hypothetical protein